MDVCLQIGGFVEVWWMGMALQSMGSNVCDGHAFPSLVSAVKKRMACNAVLNNLEALGASQYGRDHVVRWLVGETGSG